MDDEIVKQIAAMKELIDSYEWTKNSSATWKYIYPKHVRAWIGLVKDMGNTYNLNSKTMNILFFSSFHVIDVSRRDSKINEMWSVITSGDVIRLIVMNSSALTRFIEKPRHTCIQLNVFTNRVGLSVEGVCRLFHSNEGTFSRILDAPDDSMRKLEIFSSKVGLSIPKICTYLRGDCSWLPRII